LEEALGQRLREAAERAAPTLAAPRHAPEELGSYSRESAAWLEGRYLTLRPSFGAAGALFAYRTEIAWDAEAARLVFREAERLDAPFAQTGHVSVPNQSGTIYLVTNWQGQYRIAMLGRPTIQGEMYGVLTTLHAGRGSQLTPAASPIALIPERSAPSVAYGRITPDLPDYAACRRQLGRVCEDSYALFFTCPS
ncbi:transcriptional regulator, partial [Methylobacterium trifolii]